MYVCMKSLLYRQELPRVQNSNEKLQLQTGIKITAGVCTFHGNKPFLRVAQECDEVCRFNSCSNDYFSTKLLRVDADKLVKYNWNYL